MTRAELRVFWGEHSCGCGSPEDALAALLNLLRLHRDSAWDEIRALIADEGLRMLLLYQLEHMDLTEHGTSVNCGWLTEHGESVFAALEVEAVDGFKGLLARHCACGFDINDRAHSCI